MLEMPLLEPVTLSVSASISRRTSSKSVKTRPLACRNSAYSKSSGIADNNKQQENRWLTRKLE